MRHTTPDAGTPEVFAPGLTLDQVSPKRQSALRMKLGLGALAILCVNLGIGLFAREQQRSILDHAVNVYDTAVTSTTYVHEARIQFQKFMDRRERATGAEDVQAANAHLSAVLDDLDVAIERADSERSRSLGLAVRQKIAALAEIEPEHSAIPARLAELEASLESLGQIASAVVLRARDDIDQFSTRSDYLLLASIITSVLLAGLSLYLLRQIVAASTLASITHMASHDALTGLPNRLLLHGRLGESLEKLRRGNGAFALLSVDIDRFKSVNDTLGHVTGDILLIEIARRIALCLRPMDMVARFGGDEFVILQSSQPTIDEALTRSEELADRLVRDLGAPYEIKGHTILVGASVGIALAPTDGEQVEDLLRASDLALYQAKIQGKGCYRFFTADMNAVMQTRRVMEIDLREAVEAGRLTVAFQPQVDMKTGLIKSCEALVRWTHPLRGPVPPDEFIPLAEETGLINQIGEFVLRTACQEAASWGRDVGVAVNLSAVQFHTEDLPELVAGVLAQTGLPAHRLELEITESILIEDKDTVMQKLVALRDLGVHIALDDFGTGYSSLAYLSSFPFDKIKIDRSFVRDLTKRPDAAAIIRAILGLAHTLQMTSKPRTN